MAVGRQSSVLKKVRYLLDWTRFSCHRLVANQVRLHLFVLAYNLGNFLRRLGLARDNQILVLTQPSGEVDQDGGLDCAPCSADCLPIG